MPAGCEPLADGNKYIISTTTIVITKLTYFIIQVNMMQLSWAQD